ncbi:hypothetical protein GCM10023169_26910 [Georgenia halophila]|uniref:Mce-associated membrane protein n=1 Tax=Georgenia halophila TaxID=620889 RepID=A0ABP8LF50_9MICO
MSQTQVRAPRRWGLRLFVLVVVAGVLAALATWVYGLTREAEQTSTPSPSGLPSSGQSDGDGARVANGCLGGQAVTAQTVLTAQGQAPLDDVGAAEFAATTSRWLGVSDATIPPANEIPTVMEAVTAQRATDAVTQVAERLKELGAGAVRKGPPVATTHGGYYIESSANDEVVVSVLVTVPRWSDENTDEVWASSGTFTLDRSSGKWLLVDFSGTREPDDLRSVMTPYVGGC